ncbi:hypothetical protein ACOSP7_005670 [Xanthoceras sorbifolium]
MAVEDDMTEGSISSLIVDSLDSNRSGDVLSSEDLAWVDSCLIKDAEISDSNWNALKDALLEIADSQPESFSYSAVRIESSPEGTDMEILPSSEEAEAARFPVRNDDDDVSANLKSGKIMDSYQINKKIISQLLEDDPTETFVADPFLQSYKYGERVSEVFDSGLKNYDLLAVEMEPLSDDIFKVWDLGVPAEEDELIKQLKKALVDTSLKSIPSALDDSGASKDFKDDSLDNLIAGIADLSLNPNSS